MSEVFAQRPKQQLQMGPTRPQGQRFLCIVPPGPGGVADYADLLAGAMGTQCAIRAFDPAAQLDGESVILHYSGYGYSRWGAPLVLLRWLNTQRDRMQSLGTFFHETYATGAVYRSAFWMSPIQRHVARQLARRSTFWLSSMEVTTRWLEDQAPGVPHATLGVCSTIGEARDGQSDRDNVIVVFGGTALRAATWAKYGNQLCAWARERNLRLHDVGPPISDGALIELLKSNEVVSHGLQPPHVVCGLLARARAGVIAYPTHCLAKSSVFAAYSAHSVPAIVLGAATGAFDGLAPQVNFFHGLPVDAAQSLSWLEVGQAARSWYRTHDLAAHAKAIQTHLGLRQPELGEARQRVAKGAP